jgi:hypothetical protein
MGPCAHCSAKTQVQPSRIKNGVVLPASYPTRTRAPRLETNISSFSD